MLMLVRRQEEATPTPDAAPPVELNDGDQAWVLASTALVFIMIPGLGYFYSGMARSKNALTLIFLSLLSLAVVAVEWFIWGYSLAFSETGGPFLGDLKHAFLMDVGKDPHPNGVTISSTVYCTYQSMFASITPALAFGAAAERSRILPSIFFLFIWSTLVYNPIAYWSWSPNGWLHKLGALDFAGGGPVHMNSGFAALAYAIVLGRRHGYGKEEFKPHNYSHIMLGTALLWFGWLGFNPGSTAAANGRSGMAAIVTNVAAASAGLTWVLLAYRHERKFSSFHFCSGVVAGLVAITPGSGYVTPWAALVFGVVSGSLCHFAGDLKHRFGFDDALDVFAVHGIGGLIGNLLTGIFADNSIAALDGSAPIDGGWVNGHWIQLAYQLAGSASGAGWSFVVTFIILFIMDKIPFLRLRVDEQDEILGLDASQMGEYGYESPRDWESPSVTHPGGAATAPTNIQVVSETIDVIHKSGDSTSSGKATH